MLSEIAAELVSEYIADDVSYIVCEYDGSTLGVPIEEDDSVVRVDTEGDELCCIE